MVLYTKGQLRVPADSTWRASEVYASLCLEVRSVLICRENFGCGEQPWNVLDLERHWLDTVRYLVVLAYSDDSDV